MNEIQLKVQFMDEEYHVEVMATRKGRIAAVIVSYPHPPLCDMEDLQRFTDAINLQMSEWVWEEWNGRMGKTPKTVTVEHMAQALMDEMK